MNNSTMNIAMAVVLSAAVFFTSAHAQEEIEPITIYYHERVPYLKETADGSVTGLYADTLIFAFENAKIPYTLSPMPSKRQMKYIKENKGRICICGWYKNPEREKFAQYSHYIYQDKKRIAVAKKGNKKVTSGDTVGNLLTNSKIKVLIKNGYSYGKFLDAQFEKYKPNFEMTSRENINMIKMIHAGRADVVFMSQEEANSLIPESGISMDEFVYIHFSDMPPGYKRYMLFSKQVEPEVVEKLNKEVVKYLNLQKK